MKKIFFTFMLFIGSIILILISIYINIIFTVVLLIIAIILFGFIRYPQISVERLILLAVFLAPCTNIFVYRTGYIDLKILQFIWGTIFAFILIQKSLLKTRCFVMKANINNNIIFTLYLTGLLLSCLFSTNITISIKELFQYIYLFSMMYVLYTNARNKEFLNKIINIVIASNAFLVCICLISYFSGKMLIPSFNMFSNGAIEVLDNVYKTQALVESSNIINRVNGVMGLDTIAIANCVLIQSLIVNYKIRQVNGRSKLLFLILFLANVVTIMITYSRAALFLFFIMNFITLLGKDRKRNLVLIMLALCSIPFILSLVPNLYERILEAFNPQEGSTKYHFVYWLIALQEGYDNILTGIGLGNVAFNHDAYSYLFSKFGLYKPTGGAVDVHNFLLQIWAEQGAIGLFSNLILILSPIVHFIKVKFIRKSITGKTVYDFIILAYLAMIVFNLTNNNFYIEIFWVLLALVYVCKSNYVNEPVINVGRVKVEEAYFKANIQIKG